VHQRVVVGAAIAHEPACEHFDRPKVMVSPLQWGVESVPIVGPQSMAMSILVG
jgi:hypothetical protein